MSIDFGYTTNPGYIDLVVGAFKAIKWHYRLDNWENYTFPQTFIQDFSKYYRFPYEEILSTVYLVIGFTLVRYIFEIFFCKVELKKIVFFSVLLIINKHFKRLLAILKIDKKSDREKFPESLWKTIIYTCFWFYTCYLLTFKYDYFKYPANLFDGCLIFNNNFFLLNFMIFLI